MTEIEIIRPGLMIIKCFHRNTGSAVWCRPSPAATSVKYGYLWVTGSFKVNTELPEEGKVLGGIFFLGEFPPLTVQSSSRPDIFILLQIKGSGRHQPFPL